jgi:hypothetical protein
VADIFELYFDAYNARHKVSSQQLKVVNAIRRCRTAALGGHVRECEVCGYQEQAYNSCRNRHCPKCQYALKEKWVLARLEDLLPIPYSHLTFTLSDLLHNLMLLNQALTYDLFFESAAETLQQFAQDPRHLGAQIGFIGILHTWGQTLIYHPHLHFIVTGGGLSRDGQRWVEPRYGGLFLFPDRALSKVMRGKFLKKLEQAFQAGQLRFEGQIAHLAEPAAFKQYLRELARTAFVVRSKPASGAPEQVVGYLGRYTHRVAISNHRILDVEGGQVRFRYKDNPSGGKHKVMALSAEEFIRRFLLHILPKGFKKIRHFGFLSGGVRKKKLALARRLLAAREKCAGLAIEVSARLQGLINTCPRCEMGRMLFKGLVDAHALAQGLTCRAKTPWRLDGL